MFLFRNKWPRISLLACLLLLLILCFGANSNASFSHQTQLTKSDIPSPVPTVPRPVPSIPMPVPTTKLYVPNPTFITDPVRDPKRRDVMWFAPTGHTLRGAFLDYWNKNG